jgi:lipid-A-disaccharide synthase
MLIAGEPSGDWLAADLVEALRQEYAETKPAATWDYQPLHTSLAPRFFGAGGARMAAAGVDLALDLTPHSVIGLAEVIKNYLKFRRLFHQLIRVAQEREPDVIICVDFGGFNRRYAAAIKSYVRARQGWFHSWQPKIVQYVSPQVWASREGRARQIARDYDLLLSIFPFELEWYRTRFPDFPVEFVGHPLLDRHCIRASATEGQPNSSQPTVLLLPGSRPDEIRRHVPIMADATERMRREIPNLRALAVLPNEVLLQQAKRCDLSAKIDVQTGDLSAALAGADVAIAATGTVTLECALFGVPTVALYKTSWSTYEIAKRLVKVKFLAMPNLIAGEELFPEFIQQRATGENVGREALDLLRNEPRRRNVKEKLARIRAELGSPGASRRAAKAILKLLAKGEKTP